MHPQQPLYAPADSIVSCETPEGSTIELRPAGIYARGIAFLIDELVRWGILAVANIIGAFAGLFGSGFVMIVMFLTYWLYGVVFEVFNNGATPGKTSQQLRVVHDDGTPIRLPSSLIRNLLLIVDLLPMAYAAAIVSIFVTEKFQRLGDLTAGTLVVYADREAPPLSDGEAQQLAQAAPFSMSAAEQSYFVEYLDRASGLTDDRADELARILAKPLGVTGGEARGTVERIARGIKGA